MAASGPGSWLLLLGTLVLMFNISGSEIVLRRDLDTNRELRDAGVLNVISGALGGIPGYHALSLTALAEQMKVDAKVGGLIAAAVPLAGLIAGASVIELIPRMIVGGVLVFLGLAFLVEWVWDKRKVLPRLEYGVVLVILARSSPRVPARGVVGLVLASCCSRSTTADRSGPRGAFGETYPPTGSPARAGAAAHAGRRGRSFVHGSCLRSANGRSAYPRAAEDSRRLLGWSSPVPRRDSRRGGFVKAMPAEARGSAGVHRLLERCATSCRGGAVRLRGRRSSRTWTSGCTVREAACETSWSMCPRRTGPARRHAVRPGGHLEE